MAEEIQNKIDELIEQGYDFPVIEYFSNAYNVFKKAAGQYIGFFLLMILISLVASSMPYVGAVLNSLIIGPVLAVGWYIFTDNLLTSQKAEFDAFFKGFEHVVPLILVALTTSLIIIVTLSPTFYLLSKSGLFDWYMDVLQNPMQINQLPEIDFSSTDIMIMSLNIIPVIYFAVAFMWAPLFVVFYKLPFWDAMEASRRLITRQWFSFFGLLVVYMFAFILIAILVAVLSVALSFLGAILGFLIFIVTLLVLPSVFYIAIYLSFSDVTGLNSDVPENDIMEHLVD